MTTPNTQSIPGQSSRTRDMGSVEQCAAQLHDLERWFGTEVFDAAISRYTVNREFQARRRSIHGDEAVKQAKASIVRARRLGHHKLADLLAAGLANAKPLPVVTPYLGAATIPAQSTTAHAA